MKQLKVKLESMGTAAVVDFTRKHHAGFSLPGGEIFAVGQDADTDEPVFGLVSERNDALEESDKVSGELGISAVHFAAFERAIRQEAAACKVKAPFAVTILTNHGACSFPVMRLRRAVTKECR